MNLRFFFAIFACAIAAGAARADDGRAEDGAPEPAAIEAIRRLPDAPRALAPSSVSVADAIAASPVISPVATPEKTAPLAAAVSQTATSSAFSRESLRELARRRGLALPLPNAQIVVLKSQRRLDLMSGSTLVKSYRVALGQNPIGHKKKQGDSRTPEGRFYICLRKTQNSDFHIFLGLSYPALPDAARAAGNRQITAREYQLIRQRLASRGTPLWRTSLGGWVGIHGGTGGAFAQKKTRQRQSPDWTAGCIALSDREIEELAAATQIGTPVLVRP